jgi:hypothetical protein
MYTTKRVSVVREVLERPTNHEDIFTFDLHSDGREQTLG